MDENKNLTVDQSSLIPMTKEQVVIKNFFKSYTGKYLDIGAYDGVIGSNTYELLKSGWSGISVEPSPVNFSLLSENYTKYPAAVLVNSAIVPDYWNQSLTFYEPLKLKDGEYLPFGISSFSKYHVDWFTNKINEDTVMTSIDVNTIKVTDFFNQYGYDFDYISIDVESLNFELAISIPWNKFSNLKLITIEIDVYDYRVVSLFEHFNFRPIATIDANLFLTKIN